MSNKKLIKYHLQSFDFDLVEINELTNKFKICWVDAEQICFETSKDQIFQGRRGFSLYLLTIN